MTTSPGKASRHAVIFLVDGMRPDGLLASKTPFFDQMLTRGAHTYDVKTVMPSTTLPCHTSLFFSVTPDVHGIRDNDWNPLPRQIPSLFDVIHEQDLPAASFFNWEPLRDLSRPGSLAASFFLKDAPGDDGRCDRELTSLAFSWFRSHEWVFGFLYLHNTDKTGHGSGWMSDAYLDAIANADRCIERVCSILPEDTLIIVTSDHGGHDHTHHTDLAEDMTVPLIMQGPGVPKNLEIKEKVSIMDIAPTIVRFLGFEKPEGWQGKEIVL
jgi:predicted AlkP superfamily pyrophosphatase or phosphodiesterase